MRRQHDTRWPRKLKIVVRKFYESEPWTWRERRRFLRWVNRERHRSGVPPIRRLPDGRAFLLDLPW